MEIIVAVSGGPDSMALLDILMKQDFDIVVAHVNYKVRDTADRDQQIVEEYCRTYEIPIEILEDKKSSKGNFQAYARDLRYQFINELAKKHQIKEVYVAHHLDDVLETYLLQKDRGITPTYYGIQERSKILDVVIVRPLLNKTKEELIYYCQKENIPYGIDESNETNDYKRNEIRNTKLNNLCIKEKIELKQNIDSLNLKLCDRQKETETNLIKFLETKSIKDLLILKDERSIDVLRLWFTRYKIYNVSFEEFSNILLFLKAEGNGEYVISDSFILDKSYGLLEIVSKNIEGYKYVFDKLIYTDKDYFKISNEGTSFDAVTLKDSDYPITIRNYRDGDKIKMTYGTKSINRFFIDKKIPLYLRKTWPVVLNAMGEVILVPGLGCNVTHYSNNPTLFVVK